MHRRVPLVKNLQAEKAAPPSLQPLSSFGPAPAALLLIIALLLTGIAWHYTSLRIEETARAQFDRKVLEAKEAIHQRLQAYIDTLLAVRGLFTLHDEISPAEWKGFVHQLDLQKRYPGIHDIAFARYVPNSEKAEYERRVRRDTRVDPNGHPDFSIHPAGERDAYYPLEYLETFSPSPKQFGFDVGSDPVRRLVIEQARDSGGPVATGRIVLVFPRESGFAIRLAVYRYGMPHESVEERRRALLGFASAAFSMTELLKEVWGDYARREVDFKIYDMEPSIDGEPNRSVKPSQLLYDDEILYSKVPNNYPRFRRREVVEVAGRQWVVDASTKPDIKMGLQESLPLFVLFGGSVISVSLFYVVRAIGLSQRRAVDLAAVMTADLRETEEKFRVLFDQAAVGMAQLDLDGHFLKMNQKVTDLLGYTEEELLGRTFSQITHPDDVGPNLDLKRRLFAGEIDTYEMEKRYLRKEGGVIWAHLNVSLIYDGYGEPKYFIGVINDISDRRRAEEALRESESRLRMIIDNVPECVKTVSLDGSLLAVNRAGLRMVEAESSDEVVGRKIIDAIHPEDRPTFLQFHTAVCGGRAERLQYRLVGLQGTLRWMDSHAVPLRNERGEIASILSVTRDITEQKRVEETLRENKRALSTLISNLPGIAYRCRNDHDWTAEFISEGCYPLTGYRPTDFIENKKISFGKLIHPDHQDRVWSDVQAALQEKKPFQLVYRIIAASGEEKWVWEQGRGIFSPEGALLALEGLVMEITEQKRAEEALRRSRQQLRDLSARLQTILEEERTRISREIHDELGQQLTILRMDLSWVLKRLSVEQAILRERTQSMVGLVDTTIQSVRKISTEMRPGVLDDLGLTAAMEWQMEEFKSRTGIRCSFTVCPEEITLDPGRSTTLFRIFQETLTNIVRHADADEVRIRLEQVEGHLLLEVRDNGRGISEKEIAHSKSLGLIGMRERALSWGGTVRMKGAPGKGTSISVDLPLSLPSQVAEASF